MRRRLLYSLFSLPFLFLSLYATHHLHRLLQNALDAVSIKEAEKVDNGEDVGEDGDGVLGGGQEAELGEEILHVFLFYSFLPI